MPITAEQLEAIKAANHAKTKAWEAATFLTGEIVNFAYTGSYPNIIRTKNGLWQCSATGTLYETLSRWAREKWGGPINFKNALFLYNDDGKTRRMCVSYMPPVAERSTYYPWNCMGPNWKSSAAAQAPTLIPAQASASALIATTPAPIKTPKQSAQIETPTAQPVKNLRTYTFEEIKHVIDAMVEWIDKKDQSVSRKSAGIGELIDWLIKNKNVIIQYMLDKPSWHLTLNAVIIAYADDFVGNDTYEEIVGEKVDEYLEYFTDIE